MSKKSTDAEIDIRVCEVQELLLNGETRSSIVRYGSKWQISSRQIDDYIAAAKLLIKEINSTSTKEYIALLSRNLWKTFRVSMSSGDMAEANKSLMNLAKINGVGEESLSVVVTEIDNLTQFSDDDITDRLREDH